MGGRGKGRVGDLMERGDVGFYMEEAEWGALCCR